MSLERRDKLIDDLIADRPQLGRIVTDQATMMQGNWDLVAFSYQQAFDVLWDHTASQSVSFSLLVGPLMMLWHQSVEVTIKAAITETRRAMPPTHHRLTDLFDDLKIARAEVGGLEDDETSYTDRVRATVVEFQKVTASADRYRYPISTRGAPYPGLAVNIERLYQAHWLITNWCEAAALEAQHHHAVANAGEDIPRVTGTHHR